MQQDISKTIVFRFENRFTNQEILTLETPYLPFLATKGYYSKLYKRSKEAAAMNFEKSLVKCKYYFKTSKDDRSIISFPNGIKLDVPYNLSRDDINIIKHYFEGIKMSLKP